MYIILSAAENRMSNFGVFFFNVKFGNEQTLHTFAAFLRSNGWALFRADL